MTKKRGKGVNAPFFGLPNKAVKRKDKNGRTYYVGKFGGKERRIKQEIYSEVKKYEKENKNRPKSKKRTKLIELPATLHRAFLSLCKNYLFERGFIVEISDIKKTFTANGSFYLFSSLKAMYNDLIKGMQQVDEESGEIYAEESNDLIYFPYMDLPNKILSFNLGEILLYNHPRKSETPLQLNYLKKFFK